MKKEARKAKGILMSGRVKVETIVVLEKDEGAEAVLEALKSFYATYHVERRGLIEEPREGDHDVVVVRSPFCDLWGREAPNQVILDYVTPEEVERAVNRLVQFLRPAKSGWIYQQKLVDARLRVATFPRGGKFFAQSDN